MSAPPSGLLLVWTDVLPAVRDDFNAWYDREHLLDRVSVPGFVNGRRWQAIRGGPEYFANYETRTPAVLSSTAYREALQRPTPWTQRVMPNFRGTVRAVCERTVRKGYGTGGVLATVRLAPAPAQRWPLREWLEQQGLAQAAALPGVMAASLAEAQAEPGAKTATQEILLRGGPDQTVDWALLLEGTEAEGVEQAARALLAQMEEVHPAASPAVVGVYRFLCGVAAGESA